MDRGRVGAAAVGVTPEDSGLRFGWSVADDFFLVANRDRIGMLLKKFAERTDAVITQIFVWIEHAAEQTFHPMPTRERDETQLFHAGFLPARNQSREVGSIL